MATAAALRVLESYGGSPRRTEPQLNRVDEKTVAMAIAARAIYELETVSRDYPPLNEQVQKLVRQAEELALWVALNANAMLPPPRSGQVHRRYKVVVNPTYQHDTEPAGLSAHDAGKTEPGAARKGRTHMQEMFGRRPVGREFERHLRGLE